ncbi:MAG TPA: bifunctional UDP-N-acetylglucosamine diphosphorylase/glucosamine-1-phosphate N-acetyltransferase GlmU, partial [Sulfurimonas sp.]|nr:bifunctional UDP-N-acetylglucosamine diphosphorylase/glucosamine-1-phosphate N-acetyltransferase GlmU [Sulfurimonas sp.]
SDTQLIAPIIIEDDVLIAAGTTVTAGKLQKGSLSVSRAPLKSVAGFYYKFFGKK